MSIAFDTLNRDLVIVELGAYRFEIYTLRYIKRVKNYFTEWEKITREVAKNLFLFVSNSSLSG